MSRTCGKKDCPSSMTVSCERGVEYLRCTSCGARALAPKDQDNDQVEPDQNAQLGWLMRILFGIRFWWLGRAGVLPPVSGPILDVGCGDGQLLRYLRERGCTRLDGVEPEQARRENAERDGIRVYESTQALPLGEYRYISLWHVLEHVENPLSYLFALRRLLRQDGVLVVSVPNQGGWQTREFGRFSSYLDYGRHLWYWDRRLIDEVAALMPDAHVRLIPGTNYEYEVFGWIDTLAGALLRAPNPVHRGLKKSGGRRWLKWRALLMAGVLLPPALLLALCVPASEQSTLTFTIENRRDG